MCGACGLQRGLVGCCLRFGASVASRWGGRVFRSSFLCVFVPLCLYVCACLCVCVCVWGGVFVRVRAPARAHMRHQCNTAGIEPASPPAFWSADHGIRKQLWWGALTIRPRMQFADACCTQHFRYSLAG